MKHIPIPEARDRIRVLADELGCDELREIADGMYRKPAIRRAPKRYGKLTDQQRTEIDRLAQDPTIAMRDIARLVGTDQGRVSEHLNRIAP